MRLINANFENLGRTIGNLFLPLVQKLLPYINGLVIALQRLFTWLGSLLGIDLSKITTSVGDTDFSNIIDGTDDLTDGLKNATKAAEKLKTVTLGIDELNINAPQDEQGGAGTAGGGIGSGLLDAAFEDTLSEYQKVWDEAFANMENRAQEMADNFERFFEPIKKIIQNFAIGDFFQAGQDVSNLVVSITDFFARAIDNVDWYGIGQNIGNFLAGINWLDVFSSVGNLIWQAINGAIELWKGMFDAAPIETAILSILALPALVGFGSKIIALIVTPFKSVFAALSSIVTSIGGLFAEGGVFGAGGVIATASTPVLVLTGAIAALVTGLGYVFATNEEVRQSFDNAISSIRNGLQPAIEFLTGTLLPNLQAGWGKMLGTLKPLGDFLAGVFTSIWQDVINPVLTYIGRTVLPQVTLAFTNLWNNVLVPLGLFILDVLTPIFKMVSDVLTLLWQNVVIPLANAIGNYLGTAFEGICEILNGVVIPVVAAVIATFQFLWTNVFEPIVGFLWDVLYPVFDEVFKGIGDIIGGISKTFSGLITFITGVFSGDWRKAWNGVRDIFSGIWETLGEVLTTPLNAVIALFEGLANKVIDAWNWIKDAINSLQFDVPDWVPGIGGEKFGFSFGMTEHIEIPRFEMGGFPEDGWFRASKGEYFGQFDDGTSYIANNNQIEYGIAAGVEEAAYRGMMRALQESGNAQLLADIAENTRAAVDREIVARIDPDRETISGLRNAERRYGFPFT